MFIKVISGDGDQLISKETDGNTGEFTIVDNSANRDTVFPSIIIDTETNKALYGYGACNIGVGNELAYSYIFHEDFVKIIRFSVHIHFEHSVFL